MAIFRTRIKKEIVSEVLAPNRKSRKVVILCIGCPTNPARRESIEFFAKKGFWVFLPRYRGSWESDGKFLKRSPHLDVIDVIDSLPKGFKDLWSGKTYKIKNPEVFVIGGSFGGTVAVLASRDKRVKKAVAFSPVIDWTVPSKEEPMGKLGKFMQDGFGNGYRFKMSDWKKLSRGGFFDPSAEVKSIDGRKLLIIHAKDDGIVPFVQVPPFVKKTKCTLISPRTGGHFGVAKSISPRFSKAVLKWIR
ncbi:MAG: hypothetical protein A2664_02400 [Candidatus Taylorbacteria bacterium RIFCSPHIGHO2_01_FULL_46_22b]|uniref:Peptidase S9 prolyl oligopeptidase catalytic domain-containing protein n=1 Tax=Candidatus Taylorbacteria bacterium RIFCSPHIGHO2_01_FULL_46_22b TaxID=1802301 RepID=A0A1G2M319_9BACT|nr:MAG: hypothetical protein A2664_02400 [Candidatus Taylorbacteria bacterium RIFCSPHIGHO2_01_FULL_46_22b]